MATALLMRSGTTVYLLARAMQAIDPHQAIRDAFEAACRTLHATGFGFIRSLEAGYPIPLPLFGPPLFGPDFVLEPQAQIVWQRVSFDDASDGTPKQERRGGYCDPRSNHPQLARRCQWRRDNDPGIYERRALRSSPAGAD
jgi:type V secretory pathway adhesin AidA